MSDSPLIDAATLQTKLGRAVLLDARTGPNARIHYDEGHLPGAIFVDLDHDLAQKSDNPAVGGRHPLPPVATFAARVGAWGIAPDRDVIVYDSHTGGNAAARAWWMLRSLGHERTFVLDGGYAAALRAGIEPDTRLPEPVARGPYPAHAWHWPTVDIDTIEAWRHDPAKVIVDARSQARFAGDEEPFDPVAGHIPGARSLFHLSLVDENGVALPREMIAQRVREVIGDRQAADVAVHCGSGVTACHVILSMLHAGFHVPYLYVGSWSEWCRNDRPREPDRR